ncbi:hypothetical protein GW17_00051588 [Ensete ventricosum]|nr:hypothetical protein GW17_00051588 [Ensete ventricosum]
MLLDTQAVKTMLLEIPSLGKQLAIRLFCFRINSYMLLQWLFLFALKQTTVATSYSKFVSREMSKAEALLKV